MKKIIAIIAACHLFGVGNAKASSCPENYYKQTKPKTPIESVEVCMDKFVVQFNPSKKSPLFSAEKLTKEDVIESKKKVRINNFHTDKRVGKRFQASTKDFENSGYDKGHLTPYKDQATSIDINSMINVTPQAPRLNRIRWENLESNIRIDVVYFNTLYVITGVILSGDKKIGNEIPVPSQMYKVVYYPSGVKVFIADNVDSGSVKQITLPELEKLSGITFTK